MPSDSQGNTFVFASSTFTVTSVSISLSGDPLDASHLGQASGSYRQYAPAALLSNNELTCEAFGTTLVTVGSSGKLTFGGFTFTATCASSSLSYSVGELVKQSIAFKVVQ